MDIYIPENLILFNIKYEIKLDLFNNQFKTSELISNGNPI